jgi:hypothetical protein
MLTVILTVLIVMLSVIMLTVVLCFLIVMLSVIMLTVICALYCNAESNYADLFLLF